LLADKLPAMYGSATDAIEVSSTFMKVASITETAIIHGLEVGRETLIPCEASTVAVAISRLRARELGCRGWSIRSQR
jgi:hypothetical protein